MPKMPGERDLFPYSTTGKSTQIPEREAFPQTTLPKIQQTPERDLLVQHYRGDAYGISTRMPETRGPFSRQHHRNQKTSGKRSLFPRRHYRNQQTSEKEAFSRTAPPANAHRQIPRSRIPRQQGNIYSGGGARAHGFNYFLTLFL